MRGGLYIRLLLPWSVELGCAGPPATDGSDTASQTSTESDGLADVGNSNKIEYDMWVEYVAATMTAPWWKSWLHARREDEGLCLRVSFGDPSSYKPGFQPQDVSFPSERWFVLVVDMVTIDPQTGCLRQQGSPEPWVATSIEGSVAWNGDPEQLPCVFSAIDLVVTMPDDAPGDSQWTLATSDLGAHDFGDTEKCGG
jgi:hypothetical protein